MAETKKMTGIQAMKTYFGNGDSSINRELIAFKKADPDGFAQVGGALSEYYANNEDPKYLTY